MLFDQREKSYIFFSLFSFIFYLEKSRRDQRKVKSEKRKVKSTKKSRLRDFLFGAGNQNRTDDLVITNDVLYRLSHTSIRLPDDLYIIPHPPRFVNTFFENIFSFFHVFFLCLFGLFSF